MTNSTDKSVIIPVKCPYCGEAFEVHCTHSTGFGYMSFHAIACLTAGGRANTSYQEMFWVFTGRTISRPSTRHAPDGARANSEAPLVMPKRYTALKPKSEGRC